MANYSGSARTNYFSVRDADAFRSFAAKYRLEVIERDGLFGLLPGGWTDDGTFPSYDPDMEEETGDGAIDFIQLLSGHLAEGSVAVIMEVGAERLRYLGGNAIAVDHTGRTVSVNLAEIYDRAFAEFGTKPSEAAD